MKKDSTEIQNVIYQILSSKIHKNLKTKARVHNQDNLF